MHFVEHVLLKDMNVVPFIVFVKSNILKSIMIIIMIVTCLLYIQNIHSMICYIIYLTQLCRNISQFKYCAMIFLYTQAEHIYVDIYYLNSIF